MKKQDKNYITLIYLITLRLIIYFIIPLYDKSHKLLIHTVYSQSYISSMSHAFRHHY